MAGPVEQVGEIGPCPRCGTDVLLKTTIPLLRPEGDGVDYVCRPCSKALVVVGAPPSRPAD